MFEGFAAAVRGLAGSVEVPGLDGDACLAGLEAVQQGINVQEELKLRLVAEFAQQRQVDSPEPVVPGGARPRWGRVSEFAPAEIGVSLGLTRRGADLLMSLAYSLDQRLPGTAAALRRGEIDVRRAQTLADETGSLPDDAARQVEAAVLPAAAAQTPTRLRRAIRRAVLRLAPNVVAEQERQAKTDRGAWLDSRGDGSSELTVRGLSHDLHRLITAINYVSYTLPKDPGATPEQRRFDALQLMADAVLDDPSLPTGRFGRPGLVVLAGLGAEARAAAEAHEHEQAAATGGPADQASAADLNQPDTEEPPPAQRLADLLHDPDLAEQATAQLAAHHDGQTVPYRLHRDEIRIRLRDDQEPDTREDVPARAADRDTPSWRPGQRGNMTDRPGGPPGVAVSARRVGDAPAQPGVRLGLRPRRRGGVVTRVYPADDDERGDHD